MCSAILERGISYYLFYSVKRKTWIRWFPPSLPAVAFSRWSRKGSRRRSLRQLGHYMYFGCISMLGPAGEAELVGEEVESRKLTADSRCHHWVPYIQGFDFSFASWMLWQTFKQCRHEMAKDRMSPWAAAKCHSPSLLFETQTEHPSVESHGCSQVGAKKAHFISRATF